MFQNIGLAEVPPRTNSMTNACTRNNSKETEFRFNHRDENLYQLGKLRKYPL